MECLLADAKRDVDLRIVDVNADDSEEEENKNVQKIVLDVKGQEANKQITMNTSALTNKLTAVQIMRSIAQSLGPAFFEWVDPCVTLIKNELINDKHSSQLRKEATKCIPALLGCLSDSE